MFRSSRDISCCVPLTKHDENKKKKCEAEEYGCDLCNERGWTSETDLELHKTKMHYKRSFMNTLRKRDDYCCICIKQFPNKVSVIKHIKTEHLLSTESSLRVEREIFVCEICTAIFFNKQNLVIHMRYAHLNKTNIKLVKCVLCLRKIQTRNIPAHFYMHNIQSVSTCRICLNKCVNTKALNEHLKTHPYHLKCEMCLFETNRLGAFQNHVLFNHKNAVNNAAKAGVIAEAATNKALKTVEKKLPIDDKKSTTASDNFMEVEVVGNKDDELNTDTDLITVIEISDNDPLTDTLLTDNANVENDTITHSEIKRELITEADLMIDIAIKDKSTTNNVIIEEIILDTDSMTDEVTLLSNTDMGFASNDAEDFKKYFIPKTPAYLRLQKVAGVRGIRLSNNLHVCILCREICIGSEEMRLHVKEHKIRKEKKSDTYTCSCGEGFTNKVLLKHHALKNKHVINVKKE